MITETTKRQIENAGTPEAVADYYIDPKNIAHVCSVLRNLYKDPIKAVVREYTSNALDAHIQAGRHETQIVVHLPTDFEPWFLVRDFGDGLCREDAERLLFGYGSSGEHKRNSNTQIGGFGIGGKSAFAIADAFTYTIWHNGTKQLWSCYLDEHDLGKAILAGEEPSDEPSGIEVKIPIDVQYDTFKRFSGSMESVFRFLPYRPVCDDVEIPAAPVPALQRKVSVKITDAEGKEEVKTATAAIYKSDDIYGLRMGGQIGVCVGGTLYNVPVDQLKISDDVNVTRKMESQLGNFIIHAPIGFVTLAPSREEIQLSGKTKKVLAAVLKHIVGDEFQKSIKEQLDKQFGQLTCIEQHRLVSALKLKSYNTTWATADGLLLLIKDSPKNLSFVPVDCRVDMVSRNYRLQDYYQYRKHSDVLYYGQTSKATDAGIPDAVISVPDKSSGAEAEEAIDKFMTARLKTFKKPRIQVLVLPETWAKATKWLQDGSVECVDASTLPPADPALRTPYYCSSRRRSSGRSVSYTQHSRKLVKLKGGGDGSRPSGNWEPCKAKEVKGGLYFVINEFMIPQGPNGGFQVNKHEISTFAEKLRKLTADANCVLPGLKEVYGVRVKDAQSLADAPEFTKVSDYIRTRFLEDIESGELDYDAMVNALYMADIKVQNSNTGLQLTALIKNLRSVVNGRSELGKRFSKWKLFEDCNMVTQLWITAISTLSRSRWIDPSDLLRHADEIFKLPKKLAKKTEFSVWVEKQNRLTTQDKDIRLHQDIKALWDTCPEFGEIASLRQFVLGPPSSKSTQDWVDVFTTTAFAKYATLREKEMK